MEAPAAPHAPAGGSAPDVQATPATRAAPDATAAQAARTLERQRALPLVCALGVLVGIIGGLGAVVFRDLIGVVHNLLFLGRLDVLYHARLFTPPSPWGAAVVLVPVLGSLGVTFLVVNFAPEARGHGVPEVIDATYYNRGIIRPAVAVVKSLASALAIGSGAAVGREGPIIQIGSAFGSLLGQVLHLRAGQRVTLVAAGAGAGIAATFNTPIGGVLFAVELMLPEVSTATFLPVALATGTATYVGRLFFGDEPAFSVPAPIEALAHAPASATMLLLYALLGILTGIASAAFILGLDRMERLFKRIRGDYLRHALGMALVGVMIYAFLLGSGHYYVEGVGYATIQQVLHGGLGGFGFLLLLCAAKLLATTLSLGSGSSGGIFSPSLFMGATLGAALALAAGALGIDANLPALAIVGMGAMVGGATGAAMTAVTMIFEMTRDYAIVLPMILAVTLAIGVRRVLSPYTIYTQKLVLRRHPVPSAMQANMFLLRTAADMISRDVLVLDAALGYDGLAGIAAAHGEGEPDVVVTRDGAIAGIVRLDAGVRRAVQEGGRAHGLDLGSLAHGDFFTVAPDATATCVIERLRGSRAMVGVVVGADQAVLGLVTKDAVVDAVASSDETFG